MTDLTTWSPTIYICIYMHLFFLLANNLVVGQQLKCFKFLSRFDFIQLSTYQGETVIYNWKLPPRLFFFSLFLCVCVHIHVFIHTVQSVQVMNQKNQFSRRRVFCFVLFSLFENNKRALSAHPMLSTKQKHNAEASEVAKICICLICSVAITDS